MSEQLGICLNLKRLALSQYSNYNFNSSCELNGVHLAASEDGIFSLDDADSDNGTLIEAFFEPMVTDMGVSNPKRLLQLMLGYESSNALKITTTADELRARKAIIFPAGKGRRQGGGVASGRSDQRGRYWGFKIENTRGCDFSVDSLDVVPLILPTRMR